MFLKKEYKDIDEFMDDLHELSLKKTVIDMNLVSEDDFRHGTFISCIFHDNDDTPSLQITDDYFRCYSCNQKGDIIKFIMLFYNIDFIEAIKKIADFFNVNIQTIRYNFDGKYSKLKKEWEEYIDNMEKASEEIKKLRKDYFPQEIGYDKNINYIVLPITSKTGSILGFTKRRVGEEFEGDNKYYRRPKWKHSSIHDSLIEQSKNVFNLYNASGEIRKKNSVILCEGPKDVIAFRRIGMNNSICSCGTGNSNNIWDIVFPVGLIYLANDMDEAGIKASIKNIIYLSSIFDVKMIFSLIFPEGQDPYDVVTSENGIEKLRNIYEKPIPSVEFLIKYGDVQDVRDLMKNCIEYNQIYILKTICKVKGFNLSEAESWISSNSTNSDNNYNNNNKNGEKEKMLKIANGENNDNNITIEDVERAKRILKLKYGIDIS